MDSETSGATSLFFPNPSLTLVYFDALLAPPLLQALGESRTQWQRDDVLLVHGDARGVARLRRWRRLMRRGAGSRGRLWCRRRRSEGSVRREVCV